MQFLVACTLLYNLLCLLVSNTFPVFMGAFCITAPAQILGKPFSSPPCQTACNLASSIASETIPWQVLCLDALILASKQTNCGLIFSEKKSARNEVADTVHFDSSRSHRMSQNCQLSLKWCHTCNYVSIHMLKAIFDYFSSFQLTTLQQGQISQVGAPWG